MLDQMESSPYAAEYQLRILSQTLTIIPGCLEFLCGSPVELLAMQQTFPEVTFLCIDDHLVYEPFYSDFGPLNLGHTHEFCIAVLEHLQMLQGTGQPLYIFTRDHAWSKANTTALVGIFHMLYTGCAPADTWDLLKSAGPFKTFRDASTLPCTMPLSVLDVLEGMYVARNAGFLPWVDQGHVFDLAGYRFYEQVQNGDLNWVLPKKLLAFAGPTRTNEYTHGFKSLMPENYWRYFSDTGVSDVIRLNNQVYQSSQFTDGGFKHHELFFPDGSCPSWDIVIKFLGICENSKGAVAIHCKAGLGRTGVLIGCYLMKHYCFTARQAISYIRVCRPGSVIGPQQDFLQAHEKWLWTSGADFRAPRRKVSKRAATSGTNPVVNTSSVVNTSPVINITAQAVTSMEAAPLASMQPLAIEAESAAPAEFAGRASARSVGLEAPAVPPEVVRRSSPRVAAQRPSSAISADGATSYPNQANACAPPVSPAKPTIARVARASPHWMAPNGQPRKGCKLPDEDAARKTGAARKLKFASTAPLPVKTTQQPESNDPADWVIPAVPHGA